VSEGGLYRPFTFNLPNLMSLFHCLVPNKGSAQARANCIRFVRRSAGGPTLVGCPRLLIQYIRSYRPFRRPLLLPQPEEALRRCDRDQLITGNTLSDPFTYTGLWTKLLCSGMRAATPINRHEFPYRESINKRNKTAETSELYRRSISRNLIEAPIWDTTE